MLPSLKLRIQKSINHWPLYIYWAANVGIALLVATWFYFILTAPILLETFQAYILFVGGLLWVAREITKTVKIPDEMHRHEAEEFVARESFGRQLMIKRLKNSYTLMLVTAGLIIIPVVTWLL